MSFSWKDLKALSDEQLVEAHDNDAPHTVVGVRYYLEELRHRDQRRIAESQQRIAEEVLRLTERITFLTKVIVTLTVVNVAVAIFLALR